MNNRLLLCLLALAVSCSLSSQVRLPKLISDGMVLQRDASVKIWGWAAPGEKVTLNFTEINTRQQLMLPVNGWSCFPRMQAGGPHTMKIKASNSITVIRYLDRRCLALLGAVEHGAAGKEGAAAL